MLRSPIILFWLKKMVKFLSPNTEVVEMKVGQTLTYTASSHSLR